jgi:hypothetical protein
MGPPYKISTLLGGVVLIAYYILKLKRGSVEVRYIYYYPAVSSGSWRSQKADYFREGLLVSSVSVARGPRSSCGIEGALCFQSELHQEIGGRSEWRSLSDYACRRLVKARGPTARRTGGAETGTVSSGAAVGSQGAGVTSHRQRASGLSGTPEAPSRRAAGGPSSRSDS